MKGKMTSVYRRKNVYRVEIDNEIKEKNIKLMESSNDVKMFKEDKKSE